VDDTNKVEKLSQCDDERKLVNAMIDLLPNGTDEKTAEMIVDLAFYRPEEVAEISGIDVKEVKDVRRRFPRYIDQVRSHKRAFLATMAGDQVFRAVRVIRKIMRHIEVSPVDPANIATHLNLAIRTADAMARVVNIMDTAPRLNALDPPSHKSAATSLTNIGSMLERAAGATQKRIESLEAKEGATLE